MMVQAGGILQAGPKRKRHSKALKILLFALLGILIAIGIACAINFRTILLFFGKGNLKVKDLHQIQTSLTDTGLFETVSNADTANGEKTVTAESKDKAVTLTVTQRSDGKKSVEAKVDVKKLDTKNIDAKGLLHGDPAAIKSAKELADKYVGTVIDTNDIAGMEAFLASSLLSQYQNNPDNISISHTFGNTSLSISGDPKSNIDIQINQ